MVVDNNFSDAARANATLDGNNGLHRIQEDNSAVDGEKKDKKAHIKTVPDKAAAQINDHPYKRPRKGAAKHHHEEANILVSVPTIPATARKDPPPLPLPLAFTGGGVDGPTTPLATTPRDTAPSTPKMPHAKEDLVRELTAQLAFQQGILICSVGSMGALKESLDPVRTRIDDVIGPHMDDLRACFLKQSELDALLVSRSRGEFARNQSVIEIKGVNFNPEELVSGLVRYEVATSFAAESDTHHGTMFDYYNLYLHDAIVRTWDIVCQFMKAKPGKMHAQSGMHLMFPGNHHFRSKLHLPYTFKYAKFENLLQLLLDLAIFLHEDQSKKKSQFFYPSKNRKLTPSKKYIEGFLGHNHPPWCQDEEPSVTEKSCQDEDDSSVAVESVEEHENNDIKNHSSVEAETYEDLIPILRSMKIFDSKHIVMGWDDWVIFWNSKPVLEQLWIMLTE